MDTHFKIMQAREELIRLNYKVQRISMHLVDENIYLCLCEDEITRSDAPLGHQVFVHQMVCSHFDADHHQCLLKISLLPGFTGSILPGISVECACGAPGIASKADREGWDQGNNGVEDDDEEEQVQEQDEEWIEYALQATDNVVDIMITVNNITDRS